MAGASPTSRWDSTRSRRIGSTEAASALSSGASPIGSPYGRFTLDGRTYQLATLPDGITSTAVPKGFDKVVWTGERVDGGGVRFCVTSQDGEEGYPGTCRVSVTYTLTDRQGAGGALSARRPMRRRPSTCRSTPTSISPGTTPVTSSTTASRFAPASSRPSTTWSIPTGEIRSVVGTPLDFRRETRDRRAHRRAVRATAERGWLRPQLRGRSRRRADWRRVARVCGPRRAAGRSRCRSTEPGVQFYTGNFLDGTQIGQGRPCS